MTNFKFHNSSFAQFQIIIYLVDSQVKRNEKVFFFFGRMSFQRSHFFNTIVTKPFYKYLLHEFEFNSSCIVYESAR